MQSNTEIERKIIGTLVRDALKAGYRLAVSLERGYDLDDMLMGSTDYAAIMDAAFAGDECHIFLQPATGPLTESGRVVSDGWVFAVMGNGCDIISDYTTNLETVLSRANALADRYAA